MEADAPPAAGEEAERGRIGSASYRPSTISCHLLQQLRMMLVLTVATVARTGEGECVCA